MANKPTYEELERRVQELERAESEWKGKENAILSAPPGPEDIKKAERALGESEKQKRAILDGLPDRIRQVDTDLKVLWANKTVLSLHPNLIGQPCFKAVKGQRGPCEGCPTVKCLKSGQVETAIVHQAEIIGLSGDSYWENIGVPLKNRDGQVVGALEVARDVTARIKAEESLRQGNLFFSQVFEQSSTSMCLYNPDGTVNKVNFEFCKMFGVQEKSLKEAGYNVFEDQGAINAGIIPPLKKIFNGKQIESWEFNFDIDVASNSTGTPTSKTGKIFLEVFGYPVLNSHGDLEYVVLQHYDITDRKLAEDALHISHGQKRHLSVLKRKTSVENWL